ncbi:MAG: hypothetical protein K6A43_05180 [Treponema sp.]|nr:hypothetical protein [Treponema sp.]
MFTASAIGINYLCSYLAGLIAFPLYLDSIMTIAVSALCGFIPGIICAVASNFLLYIFAHTGILFTICHVSTAVVAHLVFSREWRNSSKASGIRDVRNINYSSSFSYSTESFMWIGLISAITNSILGDTISYFFYSANTTIPQVDNAVQGIYVVTKSLKFAAYFGGTVTNLIDKVFSATVSMFIYRIFRKITTR